MPERVRSNRRKRNVMQEFKIDELSAVDVPAQAHARATIMKRDTSAATKYEGECAALVQDVEAIDFDGILAEQRAREATYQIADDVWVKWNALQSSFQTIAGDDDLDAAAKITAMQDSLRQFTSALSDQAEEVVDAINKSMAAAPALSKLLNGIGYFKGDDMTADEKAQLAKLQKTVDDLTKKLEAATADDTAAKAAELQEALDKKAGEVSDLVAKVEAADAAREAAEKASKMSDAEKEFMAGLDDDAARKEFMGMSATARKERMKKRADADPVVYKSESTGESFYKSDDPRLVRMAKQADEAASIAKAERDKRITAELTKRAEDELPNFGAELVEKVDVLRAIEGMSEGPREHLTKMLEAGNKAIGAGFDTLSHRRSDVAKSGGDFRKRVADIRKRDNVSEAVAMQRARTEYPTEFAAYSPGSNTDAQ